jgi:hypothetical protein
LSSAGKTDSQIDHISSCGWNCYCKAEKVYITRVIKFPWNWFKQEVKHLVSIIFKLTNSIWNTEEFPDQWSVTVPIHKKVGKTGCNNYHGISQLSSSYKILSNILLSRLSPYAHEIIEVHQCGFQHNSSTTDHIFCICQTL